MKVLVSPGVVLVKGNSMGGSAFPRVAAKDYFANHATYFYENSNWMNSSGLWVNLTHFQLADGNDYYYLSNPPGEADLAMVGYAAFRQVRNPATDSDWLGLAYNWFVRPMTVGKWTADQFANWQAT